ncbi:hypothetical protein HXX76_015639 [Chlamydomonas incerta]|uniref:Uncharacterized protein n=1 Tax=Chlamydomonas incerta TaxID=51695 RepID=A0A835VRB8_CHLIN|nr:hypothetical protein HXX76_015639 [Chlamydomonas incerta]|eukprot:KAG2422968.1 hypothetical protein HXX76_015639 [Chlamydomonas incerta]
MVTFSLHSREACHCRDLGSTFSSGEDALHAAQSCVRLMLDCLVPLAPPAPAPAREEPRPQPPPRPRPTAARAGRCCGCCWDWPSAKAPLPGTRAPAAVGEDGWLPRTGAVTSLPSAPPGATAPSPRAAEVVGLAVALPLPLVQ